MTAICGLYQRDPGQNSPNALNAMLAAIEDNPHDRVETWQDGPVALGCQLRWLTPESQDEQLRLYHKELGLAITADARLDNQDELATMLRLPKESAAVMSDSELILHSYAEWGVDCPTRLLGDFAFAIWDEQAQRLFAARDFIGVRPFYYHSEAHHFLFASDMAMLLAADVPLELDLAYLSAHFRHGQNYPHETHTFYASIRKLGRAQAMTVDSSQQVKSWGYWEPTSLPEIRYADDDQYAEALGELLSQSVAARIRSDYPVGAHLSGGLDCSSVAVLAQRHLQAEGKSGLTGFSWAPPSGESNGVESNGGESNGEESNGGDAPADERQLVRLISQSEGIPIHHTAVQAEDTLAWCMRHQARYREAFFVHERVVRRQAADLGIRTILSGWGGDELISFNGRGYFADLLRQGHVRHIWRELTLRSQIHGGAVWKQAVIRSLFPNLPTWMLKRLYPSAVLDYWIDGPLSDLLLRSDFMEQLQQAEPLPRPPGEEKPSVRQQQLVLLARGHLTQRIEGWASSGRRGGIIYSYPLLDRRMVEFALGLPPEMYFKKGWKRYLFRHAMSGILPDEVRWNKSKREPALIVDRERISAERQSLILPLLQQILAAAPPTQLLELERARRVVDKRLVGDMSAQGNVMAGLSIEMLVNPKLEEVVYAQF
ncbi:MAG: asparagine synthase-related protein [Chloroflexota bacterium]